MNDDRISHKKTSSAMRVSSGSHVDAHKSQQPWKQRREVKYAVERQPPHSICFSEAF